MNHNYTAEYDNVRIRPLNKDDIELLREWRNNKSQTTFLRNVGYITPEMQMKWFEEYLADSSQMVFAIEETVDLNRLVGSMALYDIKETQLEIGKIQIGDEDAHGRGIGRKSLVMGMKIAFDAMKIDKIVAAVHRDNTAARTNDIRIGFRITGQHNAVVGGIEDELEMTREDLVKANPYIDEISIKSV